LRNVSLVALLAIVLAGCGSSSAAPSTPLRLMTYHDPVYNFTFETPFPWKVPKKSGHIVTQPIKTYVVDINTPGNTQGVEFTVDQSIQDYSKIPEGKVVNDPSGGPDTFEYHHLMVAGWPAIQVKRFNGTNVDSYDTIVNTRDNSYDLKMATGTPPFSASALRSYNKVLSTLKLPF
jgi:hypothetical protein